MTLARPKPVEDEDEDEAARVDDRTHGITFESYSIVLRGSDPLIRLPNGRLSSEDLFV